MWMTGLRLLAAQHRGAAARGACRRPVPFVSASRGRAKASTAAHSPALSLRWRLSCKNLGFLLAGPRCSRRGSGRCLSQGPLRHRLGPYRIDTDKGAFEGMWCPGTGLKESAPIVHFLCKNKIVYLSTLHHPDCICPPAYAATDPKADQCSHVKKRGSRAAVDGSPMLPPTWSWTRS